MRGAWMSMRAVTIAAVLAGFVLASGPVAAADRTWLPGSALTADHVTALTASHELASDGERLHLVYVHEPVAFSGDLVYRRSLDGGRTWEAPRVLFSTGAHVTQLVGNLAIAAHEGLVVVAFRAHDATHALLFTRTSQDGGASWGPAVRVARVTTDLRMGIPALAVSSAGIVVAWTDRSTGAISVRLSADGGRTFGQAKRVATTQYTFICGRPDFTDGEASLGVDGLSVYLAWTDDPQAGCGQPVLMLRRSLDGGLSWLPRQRLAGSQPTLGWPEIAVRGDRVFLLAPTPQGTEVLLRSSDRGVGFAARSFVASQAGGILRQGDVEFDADGTLRLVLPELRFSQDGTQVVSSRLVALRSVDHGVTWSDRSVAHTAPAGLVDSSPNLALAQGHPVIVFNEGTGDLSSVDIQAVRQVDRRIP